MNLPKLSVFLGYVNQALKDVEIIDQNVKDLLQPVNNQLENIYSSFYNKWNLEGERVFDIQLLNIPRTRVDIIKNFILKLRNEACERSEYWTFDLSFLSGQYSNTYCDSYSDIVVSEEWRVVGRYDDIIDLAKLAGFKYIKANHNFTIPNFDAEESHWIKTLQLVKICNKEELNTEKCTKVFDSVDELTERFLKNSCILKSVDVWIYSEKNSVVTKPENEDVVVEDEEEDVVVEDEEEDVVVEDEEEDVVVEDEEEDVVVEDEEEDVVVEDEEEDVVVEDEVITIIKPGKKETIINKYGKEEMISITEPYEEEVIIKKNKKDDSTVSVKVTPIK